jgi:hypothetical protein
MVPQKSTPPGEFSFRIPMKSYTNFMHAILNKDWAMYRESEPTHSNKGYKEKMRGKTIRKGKTNL